MKQTVKILILMAAIVLSPSCANNPDDNFFYVSHKGAELPVWVKGNTSSKTFIIFIHGGPGDSGLIMHYVPEFQALEKDYAVVYWDQRNSGHSQGNPDRSTLTMNQFVEDTSVVIDAVKSQYSVSSLFIMGHSWGGHLGSAYMASSLRDPLVKGWIDIDGGIGLANEYVYSRTWILQRIPQLLADSTLSADKRKTLEDALQWYKDNPVIYRTGDSLKTLGQRVSLHSSYVFAAGGYEYKAGIIQQKLGLIPLFDPSTPIDMLAEKSAAPGLMANFDESPSNFSAIIDDVNLSLVTAPVLYLCGRHDGILPLTFQQYKFSKLTSVPAADRSLVIFEYSGHIPFLEEGTKFYDNVRSFIIKYK